MRWMVRFAHGPTGGNIGFHEIPRDNGVPMQSDSQLGQALSSGCVRQSTADAQYMWLFGGIGTRVVVIS
jgi:lipoprotein-anchoring transpeptidase ErfK/SrfK